MFPMLGTFLPSPPQFDGQKTIWAILQQFLNPTINEMYSCLRVNPAGKIFPTLVVRQLPFSSGLITEEYRPKPLPVAAHLRDQQKEKQQKKKVATTIQHKDPLPTELRNLTLTRFMELPRWRVHPILVKSVDLGRSDAVRVNFIHAYGESALAGMTSVRQFVTDPPLSDDIDIARNGLRPYLSTVPCDPVDSRNRSSSDWMYILSDILMGQHLTLSGSVELVGVQAPICPGDNLEFDEHVLHIEAVAHTFMMNPNGFKSFSTTVALTHGIKAEQATGADLAMYSGSDQRDLAQPLDAGQTREYGMSPTPPSNPDPGPEASQGAPPAAPSVSKLGDFPVTAAGDDDKKVV